MRTLLFFTSLLICSYSYAEEAASTSKNVLPWLEYLGSQQSLAQINSVEANATVSVTDGSGFKIFSSWQDNDSAIFHQDLTDRQMTMGRSGDNYWTFDGRQQKDAPENINAFVMGHQFHAFLMYFDQFEMQSQATTSTSQLCDCLAWQQPDKAGNLHSIHFHKQSLQPQYWVTRFQEHGEVKVRFSDWKNTPVDKKTGVKLPWRIDILHGELTFSYQFETIEFNTRKGFEQYQAPQKI